MSQPMQPLYRDENGTLRFRKNSIVQHLLDKARTHGIDLNYLATQDFPKEDREQFAQLIGYSLAGWGDLSYVSDEAYERASKSAEALKAVGKLEYLKAHMAGMSSYALFLKLCDRLANMMDNPSAKQVSETHEILEHLKERRQLTKSHLAVIAEIEKILDGR
jgi:hypothetical protein